MLERKGRVYRIGQKWSKYNYGLWEITEIKDNKYGIRLQGSTGGSATVTCLNEHYKLRYDPEMICIACGTARIRWDGAEAISVDLKCWSCYEK